MRFENNDFSSSASNYRKSGTFKMSGESSKRTDEIKKGLSFDENSPMFLKTPTHDPKGIKKINTSVIVEERTEDDEHASHAKRSGKMPLISPESDFGESSSFESDSDRSFENSENKGNNLALEAENRPINLSSGMAVKFAQAIRSKLLVEMKNMDMYKQADQQSKTFAKTPLVASPSKDRSSTGQAGKRRKTLISADLSYDLSKNSRNMLQNVTKSLFLGVKAQLKNQKSNTYMVSGKSGEIIRSSGDKEAKQDKLSQNR